MKPSIVTVNTCGFDSIFLIYTALYFDYQNYREEIELFVGHSNFSELIKKYFDIFKSKSTSKSKLKSKASSVSSDLYDDRNHILKELFTGGYYRKSDNVIKNNKNIFINCETGIGGLFGQICLEIGYNFASAIEMKFCCNCGTTKGTILPFLTIDASDVDVCNIQKSISSDHSKNKLCIACRHDCTIEKIYNNVLVLEVEPNVDVESQTTVAIQNLEGSIKVEKTYHLFAVIEYKPTISHFVSHVKRKSNVWQTFDDMKPSETETDKKEEILPYMLFYRNGGCDDDFKTSLLSFVKENKIRKPMIRQVNKKISYHIIHSFIHYTNFYRCYRVNAVQHHRIVYNRYKRVRPVIRQLMEG